MLQVTATKYDMLAHIFPKQSQMYSLIGKSSNETCRVRYTPAGYGYFDKNENWEEGWGDEHYVYRAFDISSFRNNEVYGLWTKQTDGPLVYGNAWTPRYMAEGEIFKRTARVIHYDAQGNVTKAADVTTWIKLVKYYAQRTFASGRTVFSVVELQYGFTPDVRDVREHYFYGLNLGLVGFEDGILTTSIGTDTPTSIKPQTVIAWVDRLRPEVPPTRKGNDVTNYVQRLKVTGFPPGIAYRNIRTSAGATMPESDIGDLRVGDVVDVTLPPDAAGWVQLTRPADNVTGFALWTGVQTEAVEAPPAVKGRYLSPEAEARIRAHSKAIDDANAAIMAELDAAPEVAPPSGSTF